MCVCVREREKVRCVRGCVCVFVEFSDSRLDYSGLCLSVPLLHWENDNKIFMISLLGMCDGSDPRRGLNNHNGSPR